MTSDTRTTPISGHPAFKWGVALWFALLLGLGLFVMPASVHASLADRLGLDGLLPAGAPSRAFLAGAAALLGVLAGLLIASRIAVPGDADADPDADADAEGWDESAMEGLEPAEGSNGDVGQDHASEPNHAPRRPFNPREDIGEEGIDPSREPEGDRSEPAGAEADASALTELWREETGHAGLDGTSSMAPAEEIDGHDAPDSAHLAEPFAEAEAVASRLDHQAPDGPPPLREIATGDLSLVQLTARLEQALAMCRAAAQRTGDDHSSGPASNRHRGEIGPVVHGESKSGDDDAPQAALQEALAKLTRLERPK